MHKNDQRGWVVLFAFIVFLSFLELVRDTSLFKYSDFISIIFFTLCVVGSILMFGLSKKEKSVNFVIIQKIMISVLLFYIVYFILGLFTGFLQSAYSLTFINILKNILPLLCLILTQEVFRYQVLRQVKGKVYFVLFTICFILLEIILSINFYDLGNPSIFLEFIGLVLFPAIATQFFCSYLSFKVGYKPVLVYRCLLEALPFLFPIIPNFSVYLESIILFSFPVLLFLVLDYFLDKYDSRKKRSVTKVYYYIPILTVLLVLVILVSGIFKYHMIAIGSNSMYPAISRGDAVIIEKLSEDEFTLLSEGDILAFEWNNNIVVHRISSVLFNENGYFIHTKGDANKEEDVYVVVDEDIIGIVKLKVPFVGLPSVWLSELFS